MPTGEQKIHETSQHERRLVARSILTFGLVLLVAALFIAFNGGISVGHANHTGLLPVVRRILDPNYLPGDFGIDVRFYHHRAFAYLIAGLSYLLGENNALILLNAGGMTLLSASLLYICRTLKLTLAGFLTVGLFVAPRLAWTGGGLELNHFVGNSFIMPTTFAHSFVLLSVANMLKERYKLAGFLAGVVVLFHLQVGVILAVLLLPFYAILIKQSGVKQLIWSAVLFLIPASVGFFYLSRMMERGLAGSSLSLHYIDFRHPHHFELLSGSAAVWVGAHLAVQGAAYWWLRRPTRIDARLEARRVGALFAISLTLAALSLAHFADYYVFRIGTVTMIQFPRLSPVITVFGMLSLVATLNVWERERSGDRKLIRIGLANASLIFFGALCAVYYAAAEGSNYYLGIKRYADQPSSWVSACLWVREHGPRDVIYLTPPGKEGFTYLTNRSTVVDYKINPDGGQFLDEWFKRLRDVAGGTLPNARGFANSRLLDRAFAKLGPIELVALGEKYKAPYVLLPASSSVDFETVYENDDYRLVRLPIGE